MMLYLSKSLIGSSVAVFGSMFLIGETASKIAGNEGVQFVERYGSFGLIIVLIFSLLYGIKVGVPWVIKLVGDLMDKFLAALKTERTETEKARTEFLKELNEERLARQKLMNLIEAQTIELTGLTRTLSIRPCIAAQQHNKPQ